MADNIPARLQDQKRKALAELQERLQTWEKFHNDYTTLEETLKDLPGKVSHEIMVPFGSLAFMPGKLIHTNEILVLLGDNWFAERSASQAVEIVKRRQQSIEENIKSVKNEIDFFSSQLNFNQVLSNVNKDETVEIKEELKDDTGSTKGSRIAHKKAKDFAPKRVKKIDSKSLKSSKLSQEDQDLFANLERLESLERNNRELDEINEQMQIKEDDYKYDNSDKDEKQKSDNTDIELEMNHLQHARVSFSEEVKTSSTDDSDDSDDTDDSNSTARTTIRVNFTKPSSTNQPASISTQDAISAPTDIYKNIKQKPKSILKTSSFEKETEESKRPLVGQSNLFQGEQQSNQQTSTSKIDNQTNKEILDVSKAFSGQIIERATTISGVDTGAVTQETKSEPKRISKFKAQRKK